MIEEDIQGRRPVYMMEASVKIRVLRANFCTVYDKLVVLTQHHELEGFDITLMVQNWDRATVQSMLPGILTRERFLRRETLKLIDSVRRTCRAVSLLRLSVIEDLVNPHESTLRDLRMLDVVMQSLEGSLPDIKRLENVSWISGTWTARP